MEHFLIIHYGEIGLKKGNKDYFVKKLVKYLKYRLEKAYRETFHIKHTLGRLICRIPENMDKEMCIEILGKTFGIKNYKFVYKGSTDIKKLYAEIKNMLPDVDAKTFRVRVKRSMKYEMKSVEMERMMGAFLLDGGLDMKVNLKNPEFVVDIELFNENAYFSFKKYIGMGGLPPNSQGKLISLMSSGIDSPIASWKMMRRGARVIFVHFHSYPISDKEEMEQVKEIVEKLGKYQLHTKLYLVPFGEVQKEIAKNKHIPSKPRTVLYRRLMIRIAERIAKKEKAKGLITGDSFGQVASQTPENMFAIHEASKIPLYQPLIAYDKEEVIKVAEDIGTFEISKLPCKDSCSMFMPKVPEIRANTYDLQEYEGYLDMERMVSDSIKNSKIIEY